MPKFETTRQASNVQENRVLKLLPRGFSRTVNSGAGLWQKGDIQSAYWIIECKTHMERQDCHKILIKDLEYLETICRQVHKYGAYVFDFGPETPLWSVFQADVDEKPSDNVKVNKESVRIEADFSCSYAVFKTNKTYFIKPFDPKDFGLS